MEKQPLISVIVPVYNVSAYLKKCIDSIISQTYKNIEIILVDDGSTDECPKICDDFLKIDKRIRVIHQQNGGLSAARNAGLEIANGEYIGFIDSDDFISSNMYEKMINAIYDKGADLCICNYEYVDSMGNVLSNIKFTSPMKNELLSSSEALKKLCEGNSWYYVTAWNKLYHKSLFKKLRFAVGKLHEDEFIVHHLFNDSKKIVTIEEKFYYYVQRENSITGVKINIRHLDASEALFDRYSLLFTEMPNLAKRCLVDSYTILLGGLRNFHFHKWKKSYRLLLYKVFFALVKNMDLRAIKLILYLIINI